MILSAHQPAYLPWLGYFDKIKSCDLFVFLDTVQYEKNSFTNRNQLKSPQGAFWLTIPVQTKGHTASTLIETKIDTRQKWQKKHLNSIYLNYKKAPRFEMCYPKLEKLYQADFEYLSDLCFYQLLFWLREFKIRTQIVRSKDLPVTGKKSDLILNLCEHFQANHYISGALGRDYLDEKTFDKKSIKVTYQNFQHPVYSQIHGDFTPNLGIIDYWMFKESL